MDARENSLVDVHQNPYLADDPMSDFGPADDPSWQDWEDWQESQRVLDEYDYSCPCCSDLDWEPTPQDRYLSGEDLD